MHSIIESFSAGTVATKFLPLGEGGLRGIEEKRNGGIMECWNN
jgi:hypothetical protein